MLHHERLALLGVQPVERDAQAGPQLRGVHVVVGIAPGAIRQRRQGLEGELPAASAQSVAALVGEDLEELSPVEVNLPAEGHAGEIVRVTLEAVVTETGMLQLWCVAKDGRRWKLEFNVRERVSA